MTIDTVLSRLEGVKRTGPERWVARCPAHDDKRPSLSVRETDDGRVLLHCFAECDWHEVLSAAGIELAALFPEKPVPFGKAIHRPFTADDALRCLAVEVMLLVIASHDLADGKVLTEADHARLLVAAARIGEAERLCHA